MPDFNRVGNKEIERNFQEVKKISRIRVYFLAFVGDTDEVDKAKSAAGNLSVRWLLFEEQISSFRS